MIEYQLIDYEGKIAVASDWCNNWSKPVQERTVWVFPDKVENYGDLNNYSEGKHAGNNFVGFYNKVSWRYINFLCDTTANVVQEQRSIEPPSRGGKDWSWVWRDGRFTKNYN